MLTRSLIGTQPTPCQQTDGPKTTEPAGLAPQPFKATILYVDDEPDALALLGRFLTGVGLRVITACSGAEALRRVEEFLPDVVITDYMMPGMTGLELCGLLRKSDKTRRIPIIVYTAFCLPPHSWLYDRTLLKPTELDVFAAEVRSLLVRTH